MDNVWVVVERDTSKETERLSSVHPTEEVAMEVAEYYRHEIPSGHLFIEYEVQSWIVVYELSQITDKGEVIDISEEENKLVS
jgi:uncharacterized protein YecA (UPF0149 family)